MFYLRLGVNARIELGTPIFKPMTADGMKVRHEIGREQYSLLCKQYVCVRGDFEKEY